MDGLKLCTFSTDANWHSAYCVILIVAVQFASNVSLESAIDQGNPKFKLLPWSLRIVQGLSAHVEYFIHGLD
jgi:hypothetical protein